MAESDGSQDDDNYSAVLKIVFPDSNIESSFPDVPEPQSADLKELAQTLREDLARLYTFAVLPISLIAHAISTTRLETLAAERLDRALGKGVKPEALVQWEKYRIVRHWDGVKLFGLSAGFLDNLVSQDHQPILRDAKESLCFALVIWSYTIFESFSTDLWVHAVNKYPQPLAANVLRPRAAKDGDAEKQPKIPLAELGEYDFDLRESMGTLLKTTNRALFGSLLQTRTSYCAAFQDPESTPERVLSNGVEAVFAPYWREVGMLECIRNLIAHRGGRIDEKFRKAAEHYGYIETRKDREPYRPKPGEVARYANAVSGLTRSLLAYVDRRIASFG